MNKSIFQLIISPGVFAMTGGLIGTIAMNKRQNSNNIIEGKRIESNEKIKMYEIQNTSNCFVNDSDSINRSPKEDNNIFMDYINNFMEYFDHLDAMQLYSLSVFILAFVILVCFIGILIEGFKYDIIPTNIDKKYEKLSKFIKVVLNLYKSSSKGLSYVYVISINIALLILILESAYIIFN